MLAIGDIARAIVEGLNAASMPKPFSARRAYLPRLRAEEMAAGEIHVLVVPRLVGTAPADRDEPEHQLRVDVAVLSKLAEPTADGSTEEEPDNDATLDELMDFVGAVTEWFDGWQWEDYPGDFALRTTVDADYLDLYDELLDQQRVFLRIIQVDLSVEP